MDTTLLSLGREPRITVVNDLHRAPLVGVGVMTVPVPPWVLPVPGRVTHRPRAARRPADTTLHGPSPAPTPSSSRRTPARCGSARPSPRRRTTCGAAPHRVDHRSHHERVERTGLVDAEAADTGAAQRRAGAHRRPAPGRGRRPASGCRCPTSSRSRPGTHRARGGSMSKRATCTRRGRTLDLDALAGQLVQPAPVDLDRRHHGGHLVDVAHELRDRRAPRRRR